MPTASRGAAAYCTSPHRWRWSSAQVSGSCNLSPHPSCGGPGQSISSAPRSTRHPLAVPLRRAGRAADLHRHRLRVDLRRSAGSWAPARACSSTSWSQPALSCCSWAVDRIVLAASLAAIAAGLVITLQFLVPRDTGASAGVVVVAGLRHHHGLGLRDGGRDGVVRAARDPPRRRGDGTRIRTIRGAAGQHLAGQHRRAAKRPGAQHHCRQIRRRLSPVRRHRRLHRTGQRHRAGQADPIPGPALQRLRRAGGQARAGEDQGQRRLLHGGQWSAPAAARSRRGAGRPCARHGRNRTAD